MKIVFNNLIPFKGYKAMTVWPFIFVRKGVQFTPVDENHERIHGEQQKELLLVGFYVLYLLSWLWELVRCAVDKSRGARADGHYRSWTTRAYRCIVFEREAYGNETDFGYIKGRKWMAWARGD